ncbi:MAG: D-alanine--D-alanine ligase [Chlamydiae bacterium]|jgi:D-alanine-D-alanine ligase|nr:D-alanine--D-alanine ligase [Chlamydiota bacterium]
MKIGILFGGKSGEHEVSIRSAKSVAEAIDRSKYEVVLIGIDKEGLWSISDESFEVKNGKPFIEVCHELFRGLDVVFPVLHGPFGEDGTVQGMLEIMNIPYVGASVLGSSVALDKDVTKRLLRDAKIPIADFLVYKTKPDFDEVAEKLGLPFFVKPVTMGSSVGLTKVESRQAFDQAVDLAFCYDLRIILEETIFGREFECSVLGLDNPIASLPGEVIPKGGVYSYENKYLDPEGAKFILPAHLSQKKVDEIKKLAINVFDILCCSGMARVDFFMDQYETIYVNEINTIPGFTNISLYPKLWEISGVSYSELIERLIFLALEKARKKNLLTISV